MNIPPELRPIRLVPPWKLWLPLVLLVLLFVGIAATAMPTGPRLDEEGLITRFVVRPQKGPTRYAVIALRDGRQIELPMRFPVDCEAGDVIALKHQRRLMLGDGYAFAGPYPCKRPPFRN